MFLYEAFPLEMIKIGFNSENKDKVFEELVDHYCMIRKSNAREEILKVIRERESKMSTSVMEGIAIPHGITNAVDGVKGIIGISKNGIDYDAPDNEPVFLVFLLLAPKGFTEKYMGLLTRLAELLNDPGFYSDLVNQENPEGVYQIIKKYEDNLSSSNIN